ASDPVLGREEEELRLKYLAEVGHHVQFGDLQIQTSNIKVSFMFENAKEVSIADLCQHLVKDSVLRTPTFQVKVKEKSAASNGEGRTFFGGVLTITMDVTPLTGFDREAQNTSVRLFGFKEADPERRHKAQFNGCSYKQRDTIRFFEEVFGKQHPMVAARVEPNSVFSATDNAVMDPLFGLDIANLIECIQGKALDHKQQVTGGVNFTFLSRGGCGPSGYRQCKPTVQKSGSIQLMLVDAPRAHAAGSLVMLIEASGAVSLEDTIGDNALPARKLLARRVADLRIAATAAHHAATAAIPVPPVAVPPPPPGLPSQGDGGCVPYSLEAGCSLPPSLPDSQEPLADSQ
ncbi:hypothetical protein T484DRAFT_1824181, partial [Baffinella frigidus]